MSPQSETKAELSPEWQRAFAWVERELGGKVVDARPQGRWRPAYFFDLERKGERLPLYFRGDRGHAQGERVASVLGHEADIYHVLEANGLPVPHIYGLCPDPEGIVMDRLPGEFNLATVDDPERRRAILDHYIELLVEMHAIDAREFEARGLERREGERTLALGDFDAWVAQYRKAKRRPEPMLEFALGWVYRNVPSGRKEVTFVQADSGQFLFEGDRVTALLDMETGYLGDPLADLGGLLCRDLGEPLGELAPAIRRYAELSGRAVDLDVVRFHALRFNLCTPLAMAHFLAGAQPEVDHAMYRAWSIVWGRASLAGIAELMRLELPGIEPYTLQPTLRAPAFDGLVHMLGELREQAEGDAGRVYEIDRPYRLALALQRLDALGPEFDAIEREEIGRLLGRRVDDLAEGNEALERLVLESGPERDAELLAYFHRHIEREHELHRPALFEYVDRTLQRLD
ncbi:MAG: phosphotransferase family protein [Deltaproteobacteria bacterium]|jgi:aminoglycoside phosphotransferase (APT) family kinase protein|nr:phosphotransferase family protein [Deltaproteobacteria bacterium]